MSLLSTLFAKESGGQNVANTSATTSSGQAQGYYQITTGTWAQYGGLQYAPTPMLASYTQQASVAANIPLNHWAPSTVAALQATGASIDPNATLGANLAANGESVYDFSPGGAIAQGPVDQSSGVSAGSSSSSNPNGGVTTNSNLPSYASMTSGAAGDASVTAENTAAAAAAGGEGLVGLPISAGLQPGTATAVSSWLTGIETTATDISSATGKAFNTALTSAQNAIATFFGGIENWFLRMGLFALGLILIAVALAAIAWDHGGKEVTQTVVKGAVAA